MTCVPVIERELREGARRGATYYVRVVGAAAALILFGITMAMLAFRPVGTTETARLLFANLQTCLFSSIWLLVPFLTADTLSRERREGTLGLLFLTPLTPWGVVTGKAMAQSLRALCIVLAVFPVLAIPLLLGGLNAWEIGLAVTADAASLILALAVGMLASAWSREWNRAFLAAGALAFVTLTVLGAGYASGFLAFVLSPTTPSGLPDRLPWWVYPPGGVAVLSGVGGVWNVLASNLPVDVKRWVTLHLALVGGATAVAAAMAWLAARRLRGFATESSSVNVPPSWHRVWLEPLFWRRFFRSRLRRSLDRNPIGWLQQHRALARLNKWSMVLLVILVETLLLAMGSYDELPWVQLWVGGLVMLSLVVSACGSFRKERETGALELLLVTPLSPAQLAWGRMRGLWAQFLPALALLVLPLHYWHPTYLWDADSRALRIGLQVWLVGYFLALPAIGLYYSLKCRTLGGAVFLCLFLGVLAPLVTGGIAGVWLQIMLSEQYPNPNQVEWVVAWAVLTGAAALGMGVRSRYHLQRSLRLRLFRFS